MATWVGSQPNQKALGWAHDTQNNDTQQNDIQYNDTQYNCIQHNN